MIGRKCSGIAIISRGYKIAVDQGAADALIRPLEVVSGGTAHPVGCLQ